MELLDRKVPEEVARQTGLSEQDVDDVDERPRSRLERLTGALARAANLTADAAGFRYVRDAYGVDGEGPRLYHLMLDSTAIDLDTCVDLIVAASRARTRQAGTARTDPKPEAGT